MAFGIQTESNGGNFTPVVKINAKQGRVWRVDRSQGADGWQTDEVDITNDFQFVPDFENIEIGWMHFAAGQAPDLRMVKIGEALPAKPTENHKQGFRLKVATSAKSRRPRSRSRRPSTASTTSTSPRRRPGPTSFRSCA